MNIEPPMRSPDEQDEEHLRWLSIAYYVNAALTTVFGLLGIVFVLGFAWLMHYAVRTSDKPQEIPPYFLVGLVAALVFLIVLANTIFVLLNVRCARYLSNRERYSFCVGLAGFYCSSVPIGTVLGVCSLLVLTRPAVRERFFQPEGIADADAARLYLRLLSIAYKWVAAFMLFFSLIGIAAIVAAAVGLAAQGKATGPETWFTLVFWGLGMLTSLATPIMMFFVAKFLRTEQKMTFCRVVAALSCLSFGHGTALGALTLLVLAQPSTESLFGKRQGADLPGLPPRVTTDQPLDRS